MRSEFENQARKEDVLGERTRMILAVYVCGIEFAEAWSVKHISEMFLHLL